MSLIELVEYITMRTLVVVQVLGKRGKYTHTNYEWSNLLRNKEVGLGRYADYEICSITTENSALKINIVKGEKDD